MRNGNGSGIAHGGGQNVGHGLAAEAGSSRTSGRGISIGLKCGVVAGPLYMITGLLQVLSRDGFDIRRHALSLLSNGDLGWIQIANFLISAMLVLAFAAAVKQTLPRSQGVLWEPLMIGGYGIGLIGAGIFVADPALGFPVGTPEENAGHPSLSGLLHLASGSVGFICLIAACFVFAHRFFNQKQKTWAHYSVGTGILFSAAFIGIASGTVHPAINVAFTGAVVLGWIWVSLMAWHLLKAYFHAERVKK